MKVITQITKVGFTDDERTTLKTAKNILQNFMDIMKEHNCSIASFEQFDIIYYMSELESAVDILDSFQDTNPTIE